MTREEAQRIALDEIEKAEKKIGLDGVFMKAPKTGKCVWTVREYKEAIEQDKCLEGTDDDNPIDDILLYEKWLNERGKSLKK